MSKKRTSSASSSYETTNEGPDLFQEDEDAKRVKLISPSNTTLQDLPDEIIESILLKVVAMELTDMRLARSVWKEKADLVMSKLGTVCTQWSRILTTDYFRIQTNRMLDKIAHETVRLEILHQYPIGFYVTGIATLKDEVFLLLQPETRDHATINVYDFNNMAEAKDVIPLPGLNPWSIVACNVSNCVYLFNKTKNERFSTLRVTRESDNDCWSTASVSQVIRDLCLPKRSFGVTASGSIILARQQSVRHAAISVFDANGSLQQEIRLSDDIGRFSQIICKSNGNLVLPSHNDDQAKLTEIDMNGTTIRQYLWALDKLDSFYACYADNYGRMLIVDNWNRMKLLDSEFNPLDFTCPQLLSGNQFAFHFTLHFDSERNAALAILQDQINPDPDFLAIFQVKEEV